MVNDELTARLTRLLHGLTDQAISSGHEFLYDGSRLYPDEVANLMLPSVVCIAQDLSERLGLGPLGFSFELATGDVDGFPLLMKRTDQEKLFLEVAPFVAEVFETEVLGARQDLARLFEAAVRQLRGDFSLERDARYRAIVE